MEFVATRMGYDVTEVFYLESFLIRYFEEFMEKSAEEDPDYFKFIVSLLIEIGKKDISQYHSIMHSLKKKLKRKNHDKVLTIEIEL
jgi:hypothetical protein